MAASFAKNDPPAATLQILLRDGSVSERSLGQEEAMIGKGSQNNIILADASVSHTHAKITYTDRGYTLTDLGSRNGTFLNDVRISEPRELKHGDRIKMGHCLLTFRIEGNDNTLLTPIETLISASPQATQAAGSHSAELNEDELARALASSGLVAREELERLRESASEADRLYRLLLKNKLVSEIGLRDLLIRTFELPPVELKTAEVDVGAATRLRLEFLRENLVCPLTEAEDGRLPIAIADPTDKKTIAEIERLTGKKVALRVATPSEISEILIHYFTPRLIGVTPEGKKVEALLDRVETDIGKASHNRVLISDPTVSNTHAIIIARDGGYSIVDLGSSNGTFVDGRRLGNEAYTLKHGDKIQLGQVVLTFRNPAETTENKTARLSAEALEDVRRRIAGSPPGAGLIIAHGPMALGQPPVSPDDEVDEEERKEKKKKKKQGERIRAALLNSTSRIIATILGTLLSVFIALYFAMRQGIQPGQSGVGIKSHGISESRLVASEQWRDFNLGFLKAPLETSGVTHLPGATGVVLVSDDRESEVLWLPLDENGRQAGPIKSIPLGVRFKDPEAITYGSSYLYLVTSQAEPKDAAGNALIRFELNPETQSLRGKAEIITDFRSFLLSQVPEISSLNDKSGKEGGLNIEGIAWDPNNERLLLGLRSPLIFEQAAVLVPLKLREPHGPFKLDNLKIDDPHVIFFSLGGQGIRDITYDKQLGNFLIISGAPEYIKRTDFTLWQWNGRAGDNPIRVMSLDGKQKPEGVTGATIGGRSFVFVVADAGGYLKLDYQ